jgi:hypothetical protein
MKMTASELQAHILDVSLGRTRLQLTPAQIDAYIQEKYKKLLEMGVINEAV